MLQFFLGTLFGGTVGVAAMCFCTVASKSDEKLTDRKTPKKYHEM